MEAIEETAAEAEAQAEVAEVEQQVAEQVAEAESSREDELIRTQRQLINQLGSVGSIGAAIQQPDIHDERRWQLRECLTEVQQIHQLTEALALKLEQYTGQALFEDGANWNRTRWITGQVKAAFRRVES